MGEKGHRFGTETLRTGAEELTHEAQVLTHGVMTAPFRLRTYRQIRKILIGFILVSIANVLFSYFFYTPKMYRILRDNRETVIKYRILQDRIRTAQQRVDEIRHRDNYVYRSLFSTDTLSIPGVWQPYPDSKYAPLADDDYAPLMVGTWRQLDALARTIYLESVSFDELQQFSKNKEQLSAAVPAIWPIDRSALHNNHIGAFSARRMHPVLGYIRPHTGIDFGCDRGTPVYATGDGVIDKDDLARMEGSLNPPIAYAFNAGFKWKGLDVNVLFQGYAKKWVNFDQMYEWEFYKGNYRTHLSSLDYWSPSNPGGNHGAVHYTASSQVNMNWSGYNESATTGGYNAKIAGRSWRRADYLRLKEVSVGYTWSGPKIRQALGVRALKVYATGNNLLTFTDLLEGDPENKYLVWGQYPQMMTVKLGIQVSF